jgi:hypothetical protein
MASAPEHKSFAINDQRSSCHFEWLEFVRDQHLNLEINGCSCNALTSGGSGIMKKPFAGPAGTPSRSTSSTVPDEDRLALLEDRLAL